MKVVLIGRQAFGVAVLNALIQRGDRVMAVFCAPDKEGQEPDTLKSAALQAGVRVLQFDSLKSSAALAALRELNADIGIMAYVLQFVPQEFVNIPRFGMVQYHPSLLPKYRGPSAISWAIANGETETGLSIFRPTDGLDEGPIILQKRCPIGDDDTLGTVYFDSLFPMGVQALIEAADNVIAGKHQETIQNEAQATYEGWLDTAASRINPFAHVRTVYNLIRAANPSPGAWLPMGTQKLHVFDAKLHVHATYAQAKAAQAKVGQIGRIGAESFFIVCNGGEIEVLRARVDKGKKATGAEIAKALNLTTGQACV